jgi:ribonuclease D
VKWAAIECEVLRSSPPKVNDPDTARWKVKGASSMRGEKEKVPQALAAWRERRAQQQDAPTRHVLSDFAIVAAANRPPRTAQELLALAGSTACPSGTAEIVAAVSGPVDGRRRPSSAAALR